MTVGTDLTVTGKVAQFGRGVLADVSTKLLNQFVSCLETKVLSGDEPEAEAPAAEAAAPHAGRDHAGRDPRRPRPQRPRPRPPTAPAATATEPEPAPAAAAATTTATVTDIEAPVAIDPNGSAPAVAPTIRKINQPEAEPVDLIDTAGGSIAKRAAPVAAVFAILFVVLRRRRRSPARPLTDDRARVAELLGRPPQGRFEVAVRDQDGAPVVIRNDPLLDDGTPDADPLLAARPAPAPGHRPPRVPVAGCGPPRPRSIPSRWPTPTSGTASSGMPPSRRHGPGPGPSGGVGGTRKGLKCLHAHYAWYLAGGDDAVGRWVDQRLSDVGVVGLRAER